MAHPPPDAGISGRMLAGRRLAGLATAALALGLFGPGAARASTVEYVPLGEMAQRADQILTGRVVGVRSQLSVRRTSIHTFVTIEVDEWLKGGRSGSVVTLRVLGGEAEGYRLVIAGGPSFEVGEEVLVFTDGGAGRIPTVFGLGQGKFRMERDPTTGRRTLSRSLAGLTMIGPDARAPVRSAPAPPATLGEVTAVVRAALAAH